VIAHGDCRAGNMLCDGTTISGVIGRELWTSSDPRIDRSWFLFTEDAGHPIPTTFCTGRIERAAAAVGVSAP